MRLGFTFARWDVGLSAGVSYVVLELLDSIVTHDLMVWGKGVVGLE